MSTTSLGGYKFFPKLHPLSLLAQLTSRRATGCLRVMTGAISWSLYLDEGKLTYASYSDQLFNWLDGHLENLSRQNPALNSATRMQMRLLFEGKQDNSAIAQVDYQAICWLVNRGYLTSEQAAFLIEEMAKEVLESFLALKEGSYELNRETCLDEYPKFCHLDLRSLVEHCQSQLRNRQNNQFSPTEDTPGASITEAYQSKPPTRGEVEELSEVEETAPSQPATEDLRQTPINQGDKKSSKTYTVACIDDSPTVLNSIKLFLDDENFSVVMINDPVKALMQILRSKPDLVLMDVEMPNLDGYELCSLLRRHSAFKDIPIVMVTGRTGFIDRAKAKMVRSSGYLTKPFTQEELLKIVYKHIH
ncbi:response regulator [Calothrix sp. PCC 6303]|uniref:response regulator n=1 Tax=Calothrix sp. PCC 6303 TaxID=1170562 RepID=UPI0005A17B10|nr:response regulator [Calothrix sp. PCC 6303]